MGGGGGGGGGNREGEVTARMNRFVAQTETDSNNLISAVTALGSELRRDAQNLSQEYIKGASGEEKKALDRLERANNWLSDETNRMSSTFASEMRTVLEDLDAASKTLNLGQRDEITSQITDFRRQADGIDALYRTDVGTALGQLETDADRAVSGFRDESLSEANRFERESRGEVARFDADTRSLADTFRAETGEATDRFRTDSLTEADRTQRESRESLDRFAAGSRELADTFDRTTTGATDRFRSDSMGLGDQYQTAAGGLMSEYRGILDQAADVSPERLNIFTQAANFLSNAAVQTRGEMLATADPRALELSAIADENAAAMMSGRISADVQANLARSSAMRALSGGFGASSEMGRGLSARDLGLTSLDLRQQGMQDFESQRMLNFNTRVAGLQTDATGLLRDNQQMLAQRAGTTLQAGLGVAESDRNQRQMALQNELTTRTGSAQQLYSGQQGSLDRQVSGELDAFNRGSAARQGAFGAELASRTGASQQLYGNQQNAAGNRMSSALGVLGSAAGQRQNIFDTGLGARLATIDTRTAAQLGAAGTLYNSTTARNRDVLGLNMANTSTFTDLERGRAQQRFNTNAGLSARLFDVGMNTAGTLYGTNVNAASNIYGNNLNAIGNVFNTRMQASSTAVEMRDRAQRQKLASMTQVRSSAAATIEQAAQEDYAQRMQNAAAQNSMWGSIIGTGATIVGGVAGGVLGSAAGPMGTMAGASLGASLGGMVGGAASSGLGYGGIGGAAQGTNQGMSSVGSFASMLGSRGGGTSSYERMYGPATGGNTGNVTPVGWDNFSQGV